MAATANQVVGLIEIPTDGPWSADALVKECLGVCTYVWDHDRVIIAARVAAPNSFESGRLFADVPQLHSDLEDLFNEFVDKE